MDGAIHAWHAATAPRKAETLRSATYAEGLVIRTGTVHKVPGRRIDRGITPRRLQGRRSPRDKGTAKKRRGRQKQLEILSWDVSSGSHQRRYRKGSGRSFRGMEGQRCGSSRTAISSSAGSQWHLAYRSRERRKEPAGTAKSNDCALSQ